MKLTSNQLRSIIREEVQKTAKNRKRLNEMTELDDMVTRAVQDIKAGIHPVTGEPLSGAGANITFEELGDIADDLAEGFGDGELDYGEILVKLAKGIRS